MRSLKQILSEILECEISEDTSKENCESWDSISHINIILEIQEEYDVKIEHHDIDALLSYKSICSYLENVGIVY